MEKYKNFDLINKNDIKEYGGLEKERRFAVIAGAKIVPLEVSCFGITYPDPDYFIVRSPSPCFVIEYIVSGVGYLELDRIRYKLEAGDAYIIHPGDSCFYYADERDPYKKYWVNFSTTVFFSELLREYDVNDRVIKGLDLSGFFNELFALEKKYQSTEELCIPSSKLIFSLIMDIAKHKKNDILNTNTDIASKVKIILNRSVAKCISIDDIAKKLYHSRNDIHRSFKKKYGTTPHKYLIDIRIDRAKNLLLNRNITLTEIADYLCFSSVYHFSNVFKKQVGISPSMYAEKVANGFSDLT